AVKGQRLLDVADLEGDMVETNGARFFWLRHGALPQSGQSSCGVTRPQQINRLCYNGLLMIGEGRRCSLGTSAELRGLSDAMARTHIVSNKQMRLPALSCSPILPIKRLFGPLLSSWHCST